MCTACRGQKFWRWDQRVVGVGFNSCNVLCIGIAILGYSLVTGSNQLNLDFAQKAVHKKLFTQSMLANVIEISKEPIDY